MMRLMGVYDYCRYGTGGKKCFGCICSQCSIVRGSFMHGGNVQWAAGSNNCANILADKRVLIAYWGESRMPN